MRSGGSRGAPVTGTGWGNTVRVQFWDNLAHHAEPDARVVSMDPQRPANLFDQLFGLMGLPYQYPGISEDYWQVAGLVRERVGQDAQGKGGRPGEFTRAASPVAARARRERRSHHARQRQAALGGWLFRLNGRRLDSAGS